MPVETRSQNMTVFACRSTNHAPCAVLVAAAPITCNCRVVVMRGCEDALCTHKAVRHYRNPVLVDVGL